MGGRALHLCNPGSEVEGADGAGEPSTGLVSPPQGWSVKWRGSWGGLLVHQGHVAVILLQFVLLHWSGSYTSIECLVSDVATVAHISHFFEIVGCFI